jgi:hypothetical protein
VLELRFNERNEPERNEALRYCPRLVGIALDSPAVDCAAASAEGTLKESSDELSTRTDSQPDFLEELDSNGVPCPVTEPAALAGVEFERIPISASGFAASSTFSPRGDVEPCEP